MAEISAPTAGRHHAFRLLACVLGFVLMLAAPFLVVIGINRVAYRDASSTEPELARGVLVTSVVFGVSVWAIPRLVRRIAAFVDRIQRRPPFWPVPWSGETLPWSRLASLPVPSIAQAAVGSMAVLIGVPFAYAHDAPWVSFWHDLLVIFLAVGIVGGLTLTVVAAWRGWRRPHPFVPAFAAALGILGVLFWIDHEVGKARSLPRAAIPSKTIDVLVVQPPSLQSPASGGPIPALPALLRDTNARYNVAVLAPGHDAARLVLSGEEDRARTLEALSSVSGRSVAPSWRPGVSRAIVLNVDGIPAVPKDDLRVWGPEEGPENLYAVLGRILPQILPRRQRPPVFVILADAGEERLASWQEWAERRRGEAFLFRELGAPTLADAALKVATVGGARLKDDVLAWKHRPLLFFPERESYRPLDIAKAMRDGRVRQCRHDARGEYCRRVDAANDLRSSFDYLTLDPVPGTVEKGVGLTDDEATSVYYYRVAGPPEFPTTHIDYWWYFTHNPTPVGAGSFCRPGLNTPSLTCFEHPSDWEGVTVVLDRDESVEAVRYAEHEHVVSLDAAALANVRRRLGDPWASLPPERPLVFVARDSHASYPLRCPRNCKQLVTGFSERPYDGKYRWLNNEDESCAGVCLLPLPLTSRRGLPAQWNAFAGRWGAQTCVLWETFCDVSDPPRSPSQQNRYKDPSATDEWFCVLESPRPDQWNFLTSCAGHS